MASKTLYRSCDNKVLGGVAGGIAEYFDFDPSLVRLIFALIIFTTGFGFLAYLLAWVVVPLDPKCKSKQTGAEEIKQQADRVADDIKRATKDIQTGKSEILTWVGVLILVLGVLLLVQTLLGTAILRSIWPLWIVLLGVVILANSLRNK